MLPSWPWVSRSSSPKLSSSTLASQARCLRDVPPFIAEAAEGELVEIAFALVTDREDRDRVSPTDLKQHDIASAAERNDEFAKEWAVPATSGLPTCAARPWHGRGQVCYADFSSGRKRRVGRTPLIGATAGLRPQPRVSARMPRLSLHNETKSGLPREKV